MLVLVEFETEWCGACDIMDPVIEQLAVEYRGHIRVGKLDAEANKRVLAEYGVNSFPSFIFFKNGQIVDHISGTIPKRTLIRIINHLINQ